MQTDGRIRITLDAPDHETASIYLCDMFDMDYEEFDMSLGEIFRDITDGPGFHEYDHYTVTWAASFKTVHYKWDPDETMSWINIVGTVRGPNGRDRTLKQIKGCDIGHEAIYEVLNAIFEHAGLED
jgi:hypothetical protein